MQQLIVIVLMFVLPYGTAILCGALTEWAGKAVSGVSSMGGLALGIYFFHKAVQLIGS
jgi:hypothetical protein